MSAVCASRRRVRAAFAAVRAFSSDLRAASNSASSSDSFALSESTRFVQARSSGRRRRRPTRPRTARFGRRPAPLTVSRACPPASAFPISPGGARPDLDSVRLSALSMRGRSRRATPKPDQLSACCSRPSRRAIDGSATAASKVERTSSRSWAAASRRPADPSALTGQLVDERASLCGQVAQQVRVEVLVRVAQPVIEVHQALDGGLVLAYVSVDDPRGGGGFAQLGYRLRGLRLSVLANSCRQLAAEIGKPAGLGAVQLPRGRCHSRRLAAFGVLAFAFGGFGRFRGATRSSSRTPRVRRAPVSSGSVAIRARPAQGARCARRNRPGSSRPALPDHRFRPTPPRGAARLAGRRVVVVPGGARTRSGTVCQELIQGRSALSDARGRRCLGPGRISRHGPEFAPGADWCQTRRRRRRGGAQSLIGARLRRRQAKRVEGEPLRGTRVIRCSCCGLERPVLIDEKAPGYPLVRCVRCRDHDGDAWRPPPAATPSTRSCTGGR